MDLRPKSRTASPIHLVGIVHGDVGIPLDRHTTDFLEKRLTEHKGTLLTEDRRYALPRQFFWRAKSADASMWLNALAVLPYFRHPLGLIEYFRQYTTKGGDYVREREKSKLKIRTTPLPASFERKGRVDSTDLYEYFGLKKRDAIRYAGFVVNARSFIMAAKVLESAEKNEEPLLVAGSVHVNQAFKFIENPKLAVRYGKSALSKVKKNMLYRLLLGSSIKKALDVFKKYAER
ncbi:hypothetical protein HZC09_00025 [Candidatus Micrarchaeota archaeon]|nr:hypothetical protein [Candidatus Micrarchaeota archaeon]